MARQIISCLEGHNFALVPEATTRVKQKDGTTDIFQCLYCTKCGDTKEIKTSTWAARVTGPKENNNAPF